MRQNGWPEWQSLTDDTLFPASELKTISDKKGERTVHVFSSGPLAGKEASRANGGLARASFLKLEADPEAAAKKRDARAKRLAKVAENASKKSSNSSTGSAQRSDPVADAPVIVNAEPKPSADPKPKPSAPAVKKVAGLKKKVAEPAPVVAKTYDLNFEPWEHDGAEYIKNERGDVLTFPEAEWVGRWTGSAIDASVARPTDIDSYLE
jgi:hypothetical protein